MPALFTTMSMRPKWSIADCTILPALSQLGTLSVLISAWPPRCSMIALVCCAGVADRPSPVSEAPISLMMTLAPACAMCSAISRPMPPPEPVTTATLPSSMPIVAFPLPSMRRVLFVAPPARRVKPGG